MVTISVLGTKVEVLCSVKRLVALDREQLPVFLELPQKDFAAKSQEDTE